MSEKVKTNLKSCYINSNVYIIFEKLILSFFFLYTIVAILEILTGAINFKIFL